MRLTMKVAQQLAAEPQLLRVQVILRGPRLSRLLGFIGLWEILGRQWVDLPLRSAPTSRNGVVPPDDGS